MNFRRKRQRLMRSIVYRYVGRAENPISRVSIRMHSGLNNHYNRFYSHSIQAHSSLEMGAQRSLFFMCCVSLVSTLKLSVEVETTETLLTMTLPKILSRRINYSSTALR